MNKFKDIQKQCEQCNKQVATNFTINRSDFWQFTCEDCDDNKLYIIPINSFLSDSEEMFDWLLQLGGKGWINWNNFFDMIMRYAGRI